MNNNFFKYILLFIILVLIQVLLLNRVYFAGYINPYLYVGFILLLPFELQKLMVLILAFMLGISVDTFSDTPGMHTFACVLSAYIRPFLISLITPKDDYEPMRPFASYMGYSRYIAYSGLLIFIHHFALFFIEVYRFSDFFYTLIRVIFSSIATLFLFFLLQAVLDNRSSKK